VYYIERQSLTHVTCTYVLTAFFLTHLMSVFTVFKVSELERVPSVLYLLSGWMVTEFAKSTGNFSKKCTTSFAEASSYRHLCIF